MYMEATQFVELLIDPIKKWQNLVRKMNIKSNRYFEKLKRESEEDVFKNLLFFTQIWSKYTTK